MSGLDAMRQLTCDEVREMAGAFVLGALDARAEVAVRAHLETCADPHGEIAELGGVLPAFAEVVPMVEPPAGLKARIMAAAAADLEARGGAGSAGAPATASASAATPASASATTPARGMTPATAVTPVAFPTAEERAARRSRATTGTWLLRIAAVLAIAVLGGWNLLLQNELSAARSYERSVAAVLDKAAQPGSLTAILAADGGTGSGLAAVDPNGNVSLAMRNLAPTSGAAVYEAWVIGSDGVPVPLGDFQVGKDGTASFRASGLPTSSGVVLALTLEPGPGATTPTLPIISKGVASAAG
jgi:anti-sigma-K factor RskA